ncbi:hypothetical protein B0T10DRAFT_592095 [Thelonectria olida]|uniref:Uncharacterized protein n=1 Tax=Thelonectria olida TaxID=1576542 RepID=A0A9P8W9S3_9HYPO|nr:hypothetical protein B0T10DRAFT_592095 [Thelonectria olida]
MSFASLFPRSGSSGGLGLGWLLAFSLGGAILLFTCVGLLLSWRIKSRPENDLTTTIYEVTDNDGGNKKSRLGFKKRLTRRKYIMARSTSRLSLSPSSLLPPMPTYQSFSFFGQGGRKRSKSWVEEDKFHGPKVNKSLRNSWLFNKDSWRGKTPTLPDVVFDEPDMEKGTRNKSPEQTAGIHIHRTLRQEDTSPPPLISSALQPPPRPPPPPAPPLLVQMTEMEPVMTPEEFPSSDTVPMRPPRIPQVLVRPAITDSDLNDILRSTEQRLREGRNRSPDKTTPTVSPTKGSPSKTPRSQKTISSQGSVKSVGTVGSASTVRISRLSTSPSKRATICSVPQGTQHSRNASITSIGSAAAQGLIAEAAQELAGKSSPSKSRGRPVWQLPEPKPEPVIDLSAALHIRTHSQESDESSTLSTVYSVGEQEEKTVDAPGSTKDTKNPYDPFVGPSVKTGLHTKTRLFGPRSPRNLSIPAQAAGTLPMLRPTPGRPQTVGGHPMFSIVLDPPTDNDLFEMDYFNTIGKDGIALVHPLSPSMNSPSLSEPSVTSMVTPSVTTTRDSDGDSDTIGPSLDEHPSRDRSEFQSSPTKRNSVVTICKTSPMKTMTAPTPFDERDMVSLLPSSSSSSPHRRALPEPPRHFGHIDETTMPAPISPRPRRDFSQQLREMSSNSNMSSLYDDEAAAEDPSTVSTGSPNRRAVMAVGNSVAELRRMNSMVSTYSVASASSSTYNESESPTVPNLRGGGFSPSKSGGRPGSIGQHNYLSLGTPPKRASGAGRSLPNSARTSRVNPSGVDIRLDDNSDRRENNSTDFKIPRVDAYLPVGPLRESRSNSGNLGFESITPAKANRASIEEEMEIIEPSALDRRMIRDSLGMYDKKAFLRSSRNRTGTETMRM